MNEETIIQSVLQKATKSLQDLIDIQCSDGNWNYDPYMHGLANGLLTSRSILDGKEPQFLDAPKQWLKDKHVNAILKEANIKRR